MLGRPYTGRLPTTQANLDLLNDRIKQIRTRMKILDQQVAQGTIDQRQATYMRHQLSGEVAEIKRKISNSRLSTPSYRVPRDLQTFRAKKPAKKMMSETHTDGMPQNYFGTDTRGNHVSITSDWEATAPARLDVPDLPKQTGSKVRYPAHWPGNHSPMIMRAVMETGEINGRQLIDPRDPQMLIGVDLVRDPQGLSVAYTLKSRYRNLLDVVESNPAFTITDRSLVNQIFGKINRQITFAEKEIERQQFLRPDRSSEFEKSRRQEAPTYPGVDDTKTGDNTPLPIEMPEENDPRLPINTLPKSGSGDSSSSSSKSKPKSYYEQQRRQMEDMLRRGGQQSGRDYSEMKEDDFAGETKEVGAVTYKMSKNTHALRIYFNGKYKYSVVGQAIQKQGSWSNDRKRYYQYRVIEGSPTTQLPKVVFTHMSDKYVTAPMMPKPNWKAPNPSEKDLREVAKIFLASKNLAGFGSISRRTGQLMGLGSASRNFNNMTADRGITPYQERSLNQARRDLAMAKKQAGAQVDITKQLKEAPVTRPWSLQVSLPSQKVHELHMNIDMALTKTNLSQDMFTQQAHNHVAAIINSLSSDMSPTQQTEYVVERIMSEMVNRSALLKKDVSVDIDPTNMGVRFETQQEQNIEGLGSALLKTKAAMGRLLR